MSKPYPEETMRQTAFWAAWFAADWRQEVPVRIHSGSISPDGSPEWHPDFAKWISRDERPGKRTDAQGLRTTKVMRRLRRAAVREYEVLYRVLVLNERLCETTKWLNARAERNSIPYPKHRPDGPHYVEKDTLALVIAGVGYAREYW